MTAAPQPSRRVSFSAAPSTPSSPRTSPRADTNMVRTASSSSVGKSALRASTSKPPVPLELRTHPDPLLRRLRLRDTHGQPASLKKELGEAEVVGFLFGTAQFRGKPADFAKDIERFCRRNPHRFKAIYVSVDADKASADAMTANKPYLSMEWDDGSNLPSDLYEELDEPPRLANGEDFLLNDEIDLDEALARDDPTAYVRPFSRVHLAAKLGVLATPTLVVYHVPSQRILNSSVKPDLLKDHRAAQTWDDWQKGVSADLSLGELLRRSRWTVAFTLFALIYAINVRLYGDDANFLADFVAKWSDAAMGKPPAVPAVSPA